MNRIERRRFVVTSLAGLGGSLLTAHATIARADTSSSPNGKPPNTRTLIVTVRGLCVLLATRNGPVDVLLMNNAIPHPDDPILQHAARLVAGGGADTVKDVSDGKPIDDGLMEWTLRGYQVALSTCVPADAPTTLFSDMAAAEHPWQPCHWLLDLNKTFPAGHLRPHLLQDMSVIAGSVRLSGGRVEGCTPSLGIGNVKVWTLKSFEHHPKAWTQALTDQVRFIQNVPSSTTTLTVRRTPLAGGAEAQPIILKFPEGDAAHALPLQITIDHDYHGSEHCDMGALPHNVVYYDVFANAPTDKDRPVPVGADEQTEVLPHQETTSVRLQVNNGEPYCNPAVYRKA